MKKELADKLAFQILVNGEPVCIAGAITDQRVLTTCLSWTHREPDRIGFTVGGIPQSDQHINWKVPDVSLGDEILIRIVETDKADPPDQVEPKV